MANYHQSKCRIWLILDWKEVGRRLLEFKSVCCQPAELNKIIYLQREIEGFRSISQLSPTTTCVCRKRRYCAGLFLPIHPPHPVLRLRIDFVFLTYSLHFRAARHMVDNVTTSFSSPLLERHFENTLSPWFFWPSSSDKPLD